MNNLVIIPRATMFIWILLLILDLVNNHTLNIIKNEDETLSNNESQINHANDEIDDILRNIQNLQLQDTSGHKESVFSNMEAAQHLKDAMIHIMYQEYVWEQILAQIDLWELSGTLSSELSYMSPAQVKDEDASILMDYILSTSIPFLNNTVEVADVGTALNMHSCSVHGCTAGMKRSGPAKLSINDDLATLSFTISSKSIAMSCEWYQWVILKYSGTVSAILSSITVETVIDLKLQPNQHPIVRKTEVKELGEIKTDITGVGPLGVLVRTIINKVIQQYRTMLIDGLENHAPVIMQASLDNITLPNTENIDLLFSDNKYQQYQNHIKDKKKEKNIFDNSAETFIGDTNKYDKSKIIKTDTKFQNQKVNPKFKYPKKVGEKKANHKSEEESDLFVMIDDENNINPIEEKIENTRSKYKNISELKSYKYHKSENEKDPTPDEKEENENSILENQDLEKLED